MRHYIREFRIDLPPGQLEALWSDEIVASLSP